MKRYIMKFKDQHNLAASTLSNHRSSVLSNCKHRHICEGEHFDVVEIDEKHVHDLLCEDCIDYIEEDIILETNAQVVDYSHNYSGVSAFKSKHGATGKGVTVVVLDSGIDGTHEDFNIKNLQVIKCDSSGKPISTELSDLIDYDGHGTSVAGVIAMQDNGSGYVGVAPNVNLIAIKAMTGETSNSMYSSAMANVLHLLIDKLINQGKKVDFVNISFSQAPYQPPTQTLSDACLRAYNNDLVVVAPTGNEGNFPESDPRMLHLVSARNRVNRWKDYPHVVVVGAVGKQNTLEPITRESYSSFGEGITLTAPSNVYTTISSYATGISNGYRLKTGTSFAVPFVVGALALIKEQVGCSSADAVQVLEAHCTKIGSSKYFGNFGILNLDRTKAINACYSEETKSYIAGKGVIEYAFEGEKVKEVNFKHFSSKPKTKINVYADGEFSAKDEYVTVTASSGSLMTGDKFITNWRNPNGNTSVPENFKKGTLVGSFRFESLLNSSTVLQIKAKAGTVRVSRIVLEIEEIQ